MSLFLRRSSLWLLAAIWAGVIYFGSSLPGSRLPARIPAELGHLGEYFVFGALLYLALRVDLSAGNAMAAVVVIASLYGMSDEFHQHFVVMRTPDVYDWGMDTLGALGGAAGARMAERLAGRRTHDHTSLGT
jgi:VanZ family protein